MREELPMNCTWLDCESVATHAWIDKDGKQWANLCDPHHAMLDEASTGSAQVVSAWIPKLLSYWVKAQGGSKKAASRM
jgi:hypothetical protein